MVTEVAEVQVMAYIVDVKMEVVWVDELFVGTLTLSMEQCSMEMPMLLPYRHSEGVQLVGYI